MKSSFRATVDMLEETVQQLRHELEFANKQLNQTKAEAATVEDTVISKNIEVKKKLKGDLE